MPLLPFDAPLPQAPSRIAVNGTSGAGKTTLARRLGVLLDLPCTEMDSLFHGPGWVPSPDFLDKVATFTSRPGWVCEFQYDDARGLVADRADLMVWLDPPVPWTMWQVTRRTVTRRVCGVELWNGNREGPLREVLSDPEHVIRYAWSTRHRAAARVEALLCSHPRLPVVRLRSRRQVGHWLRGPLAEVTRRR